MKTLFILFFLWVGSIVFAQLNLAKNFTLNGYADLYYSYDFSNPANHEKPNFLYNYKKHNQLNINLLLIEANYTSSWIRANLGLMGGNYAQYNLSAEPTWAKFIYQANIGLKVSKNHHLWVDIGIIPSHLGFESAIGADCWTLTRSLVAENSPYYETGIKLGYTSKSEKLNFNFLVLNGWQKINTPKYILYPSFGIQINYKPSEKLMFNYSNFIGTDKPIEMKSIRVFHNLYVQYLPTNYLGIIAGFDIGSDKININKYGVWYSPILIIRQKINKKMYIALRGEYYNDKRQMMITTNTVNGFQTLGVSTNMDYNITSKIWIRIEGRMFHSKDKLFNNSRENYTITTNLSFRL